MVDDTYNLEGVEKNECEIGKDRIDDMQESFGEDEEYAYFEIARKGDNGVIYLRVLESPFEFINKHTTGKRLGKQRIIPFKRADYEKLFRTETGKVLKRISCSRLIDLLDEFRPGMKKMIENTRNPDYEPRLDVEYFAGEE